MKFFAHVFDKVGTILGNMAMFFNHRSIRMYERTIFRLTQRIEKLRNL